MKPKKGQKCFFKLKTQKARQHEQVWHHEKARQKAEKKKGYKDRLDRKHTKPRQ
jgi:hypothetical protein